MSARDRKGGSVVSAVGEMTRSCVEAIRSCRHGESNRTTIAAGPNTLLLLCGYCGAVRYTGQDWVKPSLVIDLLAVEQDERGARREPYREPAPFPAGVSDVARAVQVTFSRAALTDLRARITDMHALVGGLRGAGATESAARLLDLLENFTLVTEGPHGADGKPLPVHFSHDDDAKGAS